MWSDQREWWEGGVVHLISLHIFARPARRLTTDVGGSEQKITHTIHAGTQLAALIAAASRHDQAPFTSHATAATSN